MCIGGKSAPLLAATPSMGMRNRSSFSPHQMFLEMPYILAGFGKFSESPGLLCGSFSRQTFATLAATSEINAEVAGRTRRPEVKDLWVFRHIP